MGKLTGKTALVTGAARRRGLGRAIALRLAEEGADIVAAGRPRDLASFPEHEKAMGWRGLASLAEEVEALGRRAVALDMDVTDDASVVGGIEAALAAFGRIDILVNNAGSPSDAGAAAVLDMKDEAWFETVEVNLNGVYRVTKAVGRAMRDKGEGGAIINISSLAGRRGLPDYGAYCATKFAVVGLTQQLALELARYDIRVNCIAPGSHDTDMMDSTLARTSQLYGLGVEQVRDQIKAVIPMGRQGRAEELAAACAFLAGPDASYITGQTLNVDGGAQMN